MEPERLADPDALAHRDRPGLLVRAEQAAHQVVAALVGGRVLVDDEPGEEPPRGEELPFDGQRLDLLAEARDGRLARELVDDVSLGARDHGVAADWRAPLRDHRSDRSVPEDDAYGSAGVRLAVQEERLRAGFFAADRDASDDRKRGPLLVQAVEQARGGEGERV